MIEMVSTHRYQSVKPLQHRLTHDCTASGEDVVRLGEDGPMLVVRQQDEWRPLASRESLQAVLDSGPPSEWAGRLALWKDSGPWYTLFSADGKVEPSELLPFRSLWSRSQWVAQPDKDSGVWALQAQVVPAQIKVEGQDLVLPRVVTDMTNPSGLRHCLMVGENWVPPHNPLPPLHL